MIDFIPNQKIVRINREQVVKAAASGRLYLVAYQDNILAAMKNLSHTAFKVYMFFLFHKDNYTMAFSPEYIHKAANICKDTVRKAFKELCEKGYICENDRGLDFYEYPQIRRIKPAGEKKTFVDEETGEVYEYTYEQLTAAVGKEQAAALWGDAK